jgi:hypothetical protein
MARASGTQVCGSLRPHTLVAYIYAHTYIHIYIHTYIHAYTYIYINITDEEKKELRLFRHPTTYADVF